MVKSTRLLKKLNPITAQIVINTCRRLLKNNEIEKYHFFKAIVYVSINPEGKGWRDPNSFLCDVCEENYLDIFYNNYSGINSTDLKKAIKFFGKNIIEQITKIT